MEYDVRLLSVFAKLLEYKKEDEVLDWLQKSNGWFDSLPPLDLVGSEYSCRKLLESIKSFAVFQPGDRVVWVETGEKGTVHTQFSDGEVSLTLDDGCPAQLPNSALRKLNPNEKLRKKKALR